MRLPNDLIECVAFLCEQKTKNLVTTYECMGTAFFLSVESGTVQSAKYNYLVTAKHCVEGKKKLYLRMNTRTGTFEHIAIRGTWFFSQDPSVDLAVMPFAADSNRYEHKTAPSAMLATESKIAEHGIGIGEEIAIPGLFVKRTGTKRNIPVVRFGNLAAMPIEKLPGKKPGKEFHAYLVEVRSIGGLSGSPVFAYLGISRINPNTGGPDLGHWHIVLLGTVRGHWEYERANWEVSALADDARSVNMGIALVTPATELEAIIHGDVLAEKRKRSDEQLLRDEASTMREDSSITQ